MPVLLPNLTRQLSLAPIDTASPAQTPLWWVYRLTAALEREIAGPIEVTGDGIYVQREGLAKLDRYFNGHFDLPWIKDLDVATEYAAMVRRSRSNFMRLVVTAAAERSVVQGLRLPGDDEVADSETWDIWLRNGLDHWSPIAFQAACVQRRSVLSVWWADGESNRARIAVEDPQQCFVEHAPGDPTRRAAGVKVWIDDWTGQKFANLHLPGSVHYFAWGRNPADRSADAPEGWYERQNPANNPLGVVTLIPLVNHPDLHAAGVSEIEDLLPIQDRINQTLFNRQVAEHLDAFRQKWATGLEIPEDEDGNPVQPYSSAIDKLWVSPEPKSSFGQFDSTDLSNYHNTIEQDLEHLSVISRTPRHVFMHQGQAPSGDAMKSDEAGLVTKVKGQWPAFGAALREALTIARRIEGLDTPMTSEIVWADPEWQTYGQLVDGTVKLVQERIVSRKWAREKIGLTPGTIRRVEAEILAESFEDSLLVPEVETGAPSTE